MKKYPFKMQLSEDDCGAACVSMMIAQSCDIDIAIGVVKHIIKNTENGSTFLGIKKGLEKLNIYGEVAELKKEKEDLYEMKDHIMLTQISRNNKIHYVLIYKVKPNHLIIADPDKKGLEKIEIDKFIKDWIPYIYYINSITTLDTVKKYEKRKEDSIRISKAFWDNKWKILGSWIMSFIITVLTIMSTFSLTFFFDAIIPFKLISLIPYIALLFLIILLFQTILSFLATKVSIRLNNKIDLKVTDEILKSVFNKEYDILEQYKEGEIITRLQNVSQIREKYIYWIIRFPIDILMMIITFELLLQQNSTMTLLLFIPILFSIVIVYITHTTLREKSLMLFNKGEKYNTLVLHIINSLETIKALSVTKHYKKIMVEKLQELKTENEKFLLYATILSSIKGSVLSIFSLLLLAIGAYYVITGRLGSGTLLMFNSLSMQVLNPFMSIANLQSIYEQGKIAELKCEDLLQTKKILEYGSKKIELIKKIEVTNLNFEYQPGIPILSNVNIRLYEKKSYSITGLSGAGKTTFAKLLASYYAPTSGELTINGAPYSEYDLEQIHKNILYVPQDVEIFPTNIMDNIIMGRSIAKETVIEKSKKLGFDAIIQTFPRGYETMVGENGVNLSMGQKQLLNILRSTLTEFQVVIFDEITNGLDLGWREKVKEYIRNYGNIKIFITHDLEFANACDFRYELEGKKFKSINYKQED